MKSAREILPSALRGAVTRRSPLAWLARTWPLLVGKQLAAHTSPRQFANGVLDIAVTGADWRSELAAMSAEFRRRVNEAWGGELVREIRFAETPEAAPRVAHEFDNNHTPFVRPRRSNGARTTS